MELPEPFPLAIIEVEYIGKPEFKDQFAYQTIGSAGVDLVSQEIHTLEPGETRMFKTGVKIKRISEVGVSIFHAKMHNYIHQKVIPELQIRPRSGLSKKGIIAAFGTIDMDYEGEIAAILMNFNKIPFEIKAGDRISQLVCNLTYRMHGAEVKNVIRGDGGFGSTNRS